MKNNRKHKSISLIPQGITSTIPNKFFLVSGHAEDITPLNAFDSALIDAGVGNTNLIKMSSILPPNSQKIKAVKLPLGSLVPLAYASKVSSVVDEVISAGVACAVPMDKNKNGLIMEYSAAGHKEEIEKIVRHMVEKGMKNRGYKIKKIYSISIQHTVQKIGAVFAAVVLWW